jgi:predicted PurR-regulated permease PerM
MLRFESQIRFWLIAFVLFVAILWLLKPVLLPFVTGGAVAYFLAPVVDRLERRKVPRWLGALCVLLGFIVAMALVVVLILPLLERQIGAFINAVPGYVERIRAHYIPWLQDWLASFDPGDVDKLRDAASQSAGEAASWAVKLLRQIVSGGIAVIDVVALMIVTPVVAFYALRDWPSLTTVIDSLLPRQHYDIIRGQLAEIDSTLSGFIRGQALVCLALGTVYTVGLSIVGLHYGAAIGVTAGLLSFIPYVGTIFGWGASLLLAFAQFDDWGHIGGVIGVFVLGHILEAYILTPRLVGHRVGLHPVWIMFALIAGAKLMGFTGVLIAVPTAAVIGVLTRFAIQQYRNSGYYKDPRARKASEGA